MYHYTLIQTSVDLQPQKSCNKRTLPVLCPSSFHRSTLPSKIGKAVTKVKQINNTCKKNLKKKFMIFL